MKKYFILDFDSTFIRLEALDELARIALEHHPAKDQRLKTIKELTQASMAGKLDFDQSLKQRLQLFKANQTHLERLIQYLKKNISISFTRNRDFFESHRHSILIISNGFKEIIVPTIASFKLPSENIYANTFIFNSIGTIIGFDTTNLLAQKSGKVNLIRKLNLDGDIYVIGDGFSDFEIHKAGLANHFYAFTENVRRPEVIDQSDNISPNLDDFLYKNDLPRRFSYPKHHIRVLLLENIHDNARKAFLKEGYQVETISHALSEDDLVKIISKISILGIRSKTLVTEKVLKAAKKLMCIGAFCIGTNQINLEVTLKRGCAVFNAPYSNSRSVVELAIGYIIMLLREIFPKHEAMRAGKWQKKVGLSCEMRDKKIGIIGYGNIGSQLSILAEAMGMHVYYYDLIEKLAIGNAIKCQSLTELVEQVDVISLHVDGRTENNNFFNAAIFEKIKKGAILINLSRGNIIDLGALKVALDNKTLRGAAIDVFPNEPHSNHEPFESFLRDYPNAILSPHIGGNTVEAQKNIAAFVPQKIIDYVNTGNTMDSVNLPNVHLPLMKNTHRLLHIHKNEPGLLEQILYVYKKFNCNVLGQYLQTNKDVGYVVTDIDKYYNKQLINDLKHIENTVKFRILF